MSPSHVNVLPPLGNLNGLLSLVDAGESVRSL